MLIRQHLPLFALLAICGVLLSPSAVPAAEDGEQTPQEVPGVVTASNAKNQSVPATPSPPTTDPAAPLNVQLIRVRSDWSNVKDADDTKKALESLIADLELPDSFRQDLLGSASQILFPETLLAVYRPENIAALLAWMAERDLIRIEAESQSPIDDNSYSHHLSAEHDVVPAVPALTADRNLPYVKRNYETRWGFRFRTLAHEDGGPARIAFDQRRFVGRRDEVAVAGATQTEYQLVGMCEFEASFPADRVAVMHALFALPGAAKYARTTGWDPVLVVSPVDLGKTADGPKRLAKPESLSTIRMVPPPENTLPQDIVTPPTSLVEVSRPQNHKFPSRVDRGFKREGESTDGETALRTDATVAAGPELGRVNVQLIRVRSDWSKGKDPEDTKKTLETLLEGSPLPQAFQQDLLGSASQILFPEQYLAVYKPEALASSLAWMAQRDLVRIEAESEDPSGKLLAAHEIVPIFDFPLDQEPPPFVTRSYGWEWTFQSISDPLSLSPKISLMIDQSAFKYDKVQVDAQPTIHTDLMREVAYTCVFPADHVAVLSCLYPQSSQTARYARRQGWDPLLVITPVGLGESGEIANPQLAKPTSLLETSGSPGARRAPSPQRPQPSPGAAATASQTTPEDQQIKVFQLANAKADQIMQLLPHIFKEVTFGLDERTNSLIAQGPADQLQEVEALLMRLDEMPSHESSESEAAPRRDMQALHSGFAESQAEVQSVVASLAGEQDGPKAKQLRTRLNRLVAEAFDLRQKLQRAELALHKQRIQIIETRLLQRDTLRKEIIGRRVEALLAQETSHTEATGVVARRPASTGVRVQASSAISQSDVGAPDTPQASRINEEAFVSRTREDRLATWQKAYKEQHSKNPWPPTLSHEFLQCVETIGKDDTIPPFLIPEYHGWLKLHVPDLDMIIDCRRPKRIAGTAPGADEQASTTEGAAGNTRQPEMEGTVDWNAAAYAELQSGFYWAAHPTTVQLRLAQEDLWAYEAILRSIAKVNKESHSGEGPAVKRLEMLRVGQRAAVAIAKGKPKSAVQASSAKPSGQAGYGGSTPESPTEELIAERLLKGRYVDSTGTPLPADSQPLPEYNLLPVQLVVDIAPESLPDLIAQLANCAMPVNVIRVQTKTAASHEDSAESRAEQTHVRAEIHGMIRVFNPPDKAKLRDGFVRIEFQNQPWKDVLEWLADLSGLEVNHIDGIVPEGTFTSNSPEPMPLTTARDIIAYALALDGYRYTPLNQDGHRYLLVEEVDFRRAHRRALDATEEVAKWAKALAEADPQDKPYLSTVQTRLDKAEKSLAYERQSIARMAYASGPHSQNAKSKLDSAIQHQETATKLFAKGYIPQSEIDAHERSVQQSRRRYDFLKAQSDRYRTTADTLGLTPADIEKAKAEAESVGDFGMLDLETAPMGRPVDQPKTTQTVPNAQTPGPATPLTSINSTSPALGPRPSLPLRTPEEFQRVAYEAKEKLERYQTMLDDAPDLREDSDAAEYDDYLARLERDLASAQQRLTLIQAEYATQLRLLEAEVETAELAVEGAMRDERTIEHAIQSTPNRYSRSELDRCRIARAEAALQIKRAKTLLELYHKAGDSTDLNPEHAQPTKEAADNQKAATDTTSPP